MNQENKGVRVFLLKLLLGAVVLFAADRATGFLLQRLYFSQQAGDYRRASYSMDSTTADLLVLGSSRASHHYVPPIFENALGKTCYNTGRDGSELLVNYAFFKSALKRYSPELIIVDLSPKELYYTREDYEKLSVLLPYYNQHSEIQEIVNLKGKFEKYKLYSNIYPFNSQLVSLFLGKFNVTKDPGISTKGYLPLYSKMKGDTANNFLKDPGELLDSNKIKALTDIAYTCRQKKIQLFFICSPVFDNAADNNARAAINRVMQKYQTSFWDFSTDTTFDNHPEYFRDNSHLNDEGARLFSTLVTEKIAGVGQGK